MNLPPLIALPALLLAALFLSPSARSEYLPPDQMTGGWKQKEIVGSRTSQVLATSDTRIALGTDSQKILLLSLPDYSVISTLDRPAGFPAGVTFAEKAGFIDGRLVTVSPTRDGIRIDELDPVTGTWGRTAIDADFQAGKVVSYYAECGPPLLFKDEIRVQGPDQKIRRWKLSDWTPLPTIAGAKEVMGRPTVSRMFGPHYVKEYYGNAVVLDSASGGTITLTVPKSHSIPLVAAAASSGTFLTVEVSDGFLVWNSNALAAAPRFVAGEYEKAVIWQDRYLIGSMRDAFGHWFQMWDLARPSPLPMRLEVPDPFSFYFFGVAGNDLLIPHTGYGKAWLCHLPLETNSQLTRISVADAIANERDGYMDFEIRADPAPVSPITVGYETQPGTASEGADYTHKTGTVTLTPSAPAAKVRVSLTQDRILEGYESLSLVLTSRSSGWCFDTAAVGTIIGTGMVEVSSAGQLPVPRVDSVHMYLTSPGLMAYDWSEKNYYFCAEGQSQWKQLQSMLSVKNWSWLEILPAAEPNHIIVAQPGSTSSSPWPFRKFNLLTDTLVASGTMKDPFADNEKVSVDAEHYMVRNLPNSDTAPIELRRHVDSGFFRALSLPVDLEYAPEPVKGKNRTTLIRSGSRWIFHRFAQDGSDLYQRWAGADLSYLALAPDGIGTLYQDPSWGMLDTGTGAIAQKLEFPDDDPNVATDGQSLAVTTRTGFVRRYTRHPGVPAPLRNTFIIPEAKADTPVTVQFSEAVDYPLTVSISRCSSPDDFVIDSRPITLAPGQKDLRMPFLVADDDRPETVETPTVVIRVTGNGKSAYFDLRITIADNDTFEFDRETRDKDLVQTSSVDIGDGFPIFASNQHPVMADPVTKTTFVQTPLDSRQLFGHTLEANPKYSVVGSPGIVGEVGNSVHIYDRKKKSRLKVITHNGANSGFGSVLHLAGDHLLVGAPGVKSAGFVNSYRFPDGSLERQFRQPGKSKPGNRFGSAILADAGSVWIGSPGAGEGAVYQFSLKTGKLVRQFQSPAAGTSHFGQSLSFCGPYLAIGAPSDDATSSVFIYQRKTGKYVNRISTPFSKGGYFGASLAGLSGSRLAIGCPMPEPKLSRLGSVMIHDLSEKPFRMIVMLTPSHLANKYHAERHGVIGVAGSLSAHGGFLAMQFTQANGAITSPLSVYDGMFYVENRGNRYKPLYFQVVAIPGKTKVTRPAAVTGFQTASAPAAPGPAHALGVSLEDGEVLISLPDPTLAMNGMQLVLERSEDLETWEELAKAGGDVPSDWFPVHPDVMMEPGSREIRLAPSASGKAFFRARMDPPRPW